MKGNTVVPTEEVIDATIPVSLAPVHIEEYQQIYSPDISSRFISRMSIADSTPLDSEVVSTVSSPAPSEEGDCSMSKTNLEINQELLSIKFPSSSLSPVSLDFTLFDTFILLETPRFTVDSTPHDLDQPFDDIVSLSTNPTSDSFVHVELAIAIEPIDLYSVKSRTVQAEGQPFITQINMYGTDGDLSNFHPHVDDRAMINTIDIEAYRTASKHMEHLMPSTCILRMADGSLVPSVGVWNGRIKWHNATTTAAFEVFPSGGSWKVLIGKPLLHQLQAIHDYSNNTITIPSTNPLIITNLFGMPAAHTKRPVSYRTTVSDELENAPPPCQTTDTHVLAVTIPPDTPSTHHHHPTVHASEQHIYSYTHNVHHASISDLATSLSQAGAHVTLANCVPTLEATSTTNAHLESPCMPVLFTEPAAVGDNIGEVPDFMIPNESSWGLYTRHTDPFNPV